MNVHEILHTLKRRPGYVGQLVHERFIPPRKPRYGELRPPLPEALRRSLTAQGVRRLYSHQVDAIERIRRRQHVVVVTATASGKTLCYNLPVLETLLADPASRALYLFPTKALAQDQAGALAEFAVPGLVAKTYDGDTPQPERRRIRDQAQIVLTNPDMLHVGILPQHHRWAHFLARLQYVVIDDVHVYRGVFGSNVANIIRRLRRVCRLHGSDPVFICTSATIANPQELAGALLGLPVAVVDADGSPSGPRWVTLWNPPLVDLARARRRSAYSEASAIFTEFVRRGVRTIAFTQARKITELLYRQARLDLEQDAPELAGRISPYRAGYLPEERRAIERRLFSGDLLGVISTSALELGIDVGELDAAVLVGYPGTIASTWQRAGRAGRRTGEALVVLIALEDALDQYLMRNPDYLFARPTQTRSTTELDIRGITKQKGWGPTTAYFGSVEVNTQVISFARKRLFSDEVLSEEVLDLPEERLQTTALWFPIPEPLAADVRRRGLDLAGGIHAVEHAAIGILPLFAMCDRWDLGGVSYPVYPELGAPAIFIYEGHPGGVGITEKGYELLDGLMRATLEAIEACPCEAGCPSCIQSPKCGNMNDPLDKSAAVLLLRGLLGRRQARSSASVRS